MSPSQSVWLPPVAYPTDVRCGRLMSIDNRDSNFPLMAAFEAGDIPNERTWQMYGRFALDQQQTPRCVGFSIAHSLAAAPRLHAIKEEVASQIYTLAQDLDEWPGINYDGTSVRGGIKAAIQLGLAEPTYRWAQSEIDVNLWVRKYGTLVAGTEWLWGMLNTDEDGYVHPTGGSVGGHAWLILGYDLERDAYRCLNSWGSEWGQGGRFWIKRNDFRILLEQLGGEAVSFTEK